MPTAPTEGWTDYLQKHQLSPTVEEAKDTLVHLLDEAKDELTVHSAFDCFAYELAHQDQKYIPSSGVWYEVVAAFVTGINQATNRFRRRPSRCRPGIGRKASAHPIRGALRPFIRLPALKRIQILVGIASASTKHRDAATRKRAPRRAARQQNCQLKQPDQDQRPSASSVPGEGR